MKSYVLDLEARMGTRHYKFPLKADKILCVCWKEVGSDTMNVATTEKEYHEMLDVILSDPDNMLITHNVAFDAGVLNNLLNRGIDCRTLCTFRLGKLVFPYNDLGMRDMLPISKVSDDNVGKYSLAAWGQRLDLQKDENDFTDNMDWVTAELSDDMIEYCKRDVEVLEKLYIMLYKQAMRVKTHNDPYGRKHTIEESLGYWLGLEHEQEIYNLNKEDKIARINKIQKKRDVTNIEQNHIIFDLQLLVARVNLDAMPGED